MGHSNLRQTCRLKFGGEKGGEGGRQEENSQWAEVTTGGTEEGGSHLEGVSRRDKVGERKGTDWHGDDSQMSGTHGRESCKKNAEERGGGQERIRGGHQ